MSPIAVQTAGPIGLKFFMDTRSWVAVGCFRLEKIRN